MQQIRLVYFSKAIDSLDRLDLAAILEKSRENNERVGIKGLLLFVNGVFVQVLEGPADALHALVGVLKMDPRHTDLRVVHQAEIDQPVFDDWTMAYLNADLTELLKASGLASPESAMALFADAESGHAGCEQSARRIGKAITQAVESFADRLRDGNTAAARFSV